MQKGAKIILGQLPMEFADGIHTEYELARRYCKEALIFDQPFFWAHENGFDQWFLDAGTLDVSKVLNGMTILWDCRSGMAPPVHESDLVNSAPGSTPLVQVFLLTHSKLGTFAVYPHLSNKGGKAGAWDDFEFWTDGLTPEQLQFLKDKDYFIQDKARKKASPEVLERMRGDFDPKLFLVRYSHSAAIPTTPRTCVAILLCTISSQSAIESGPPSACGTSSGAQIVTILPAHRGCAAAS